MLPCEVLKICRLCLVNEEVNVNIFENKSKPLSYKIAACLPITVTANDGLPGKVCVNCYDKVNLLYEFWNQTLNAEKHLLVWLGEEAKSSGNNLYSHLNQEKETGGCVTRKDEGTIGGSGESKEENGRGKAIPVGDRPGDISERAESVCGLNSDDNDCMSNVEWNANDDEEGEHLESSSVARETFPSSKQLRGLNETAEKELKKLLWFNEKKRCYEIAEDAATVAQVDSDKMEVPLVGRQKGTSKSQNVRINVRDCSQSADASANGKRRAKSKKKQGSKTINGDKNKSGAMMTVATTSVAAAVAEVTRGQGFKCAHCDRIFESARTRTKHEKSAHSKREVRYDCDKCSYSTYTKGCFTTHLKRHIKQYNLFCVECNVGFFNNTELTSHNIKLHAMQPFQCAICNDEFTSKGNLYSHIKSHDPNNTYVCEICGRTYKKKNSYKRHIARSHLGLTTKAQCAICQRVLSSKEHLRRHMLTHTDERNWVCSTCGKCFLSKTYLTEHSRIHLGIRPYKCEICGKCFTQRGSLTIHKRSHTGERPFRCQYCHKGFVMSTLLRYHLKKCGEAKLGTHFFTHSPVDSDPYVVRPSSSSEIGSYSPQIIELATPIAPATAIVEHPAPSSESAGHMSFEFPLLTPPPTTRMSTAGVASAASSQVLIYPKSEHVSVIATSETNSISGGGGFGAR